MISEQSPIRSIDGKGKTIKEILFARKFYIDYYQREYKWQTKQVEELINDLTGIFLNDFSASHDRDEVAKYAHYFLGSIIISSKNGKDHIIDGQQRLTTLSLLIMWLLHRLKEQGEDDSLAQLVYSKKHGKVSFNLGELKVTQTFIQICVKNRLACQLRFASRLIHCVTFNSLSRLIHSSRLIHCPSLICTSFAPHSLTADGGSWPSDCAARTTSRARRRGRLDWIPKCHWCSSTSKDLTIGAAISKSSGVGV